MAEMRVWSVVGFLAFPFPFPQFSTTILGLYQPPYPQVSISFGSSKEVEERKPTRGRQRSFSNGLSSLTSPLKKRGFAAHSLVPGSRARRHPVSVYSPNPKKNKALCSHGDEKLQEKPGAARAN